MNINPLYIKAPLQKIEFIQTIIRVVSENQKLIPEQIHLESRKRRIVQARQLCHVFAILMVDAGLAVIGSEIGDKAHATVLHAKKVVNNLIDTDPNFRGNFNMLYAKLNNLALSKNEKMLVCSSCGSNLLRSIVTIDPNSKLIIQDIEYTNINKNFCIKCNRPTKLISYGMYVKIKKQKLVMS